MNPGIVIEVLTPDFLDRDDAIEQVLLARPEIFNHNLETVRRLTPRVRHRATYDRSLGIVERIMLGRFRQAYGALLRGETLEPGSSRGVSNVFADETAHVTVEDGVLLAILPGEDA